MPLHQFKPSRYALNRAENGFKPVLRARMSPRSMELFEFQLLEGRLWNDSIDEMFTKNSFKCIINESAKKYLASRILRVTNFRVKTKVGLPVMFHPSIILLLKSWEL